MIGVKDLCKAYEGKAVLKDFSITFPTGKTSCLLGPSGCGKTTLLMLLSGLLTPDSGQILGIAPYMKKSVVFQEDRLLPQLTVFFNLAAVCNDLTKIKTALQMAELWEERCQYPEKLSGGMQRRLAIARAAAYNGELFLLDEPFRGIDWERKERMIESLKQSLSGKTCITITHDREEAELFADQLFFVEGPPLVLRQE